MNNYLIILLIILIFFMTFKKNNFEYFNFGDNVKLGKTVNSNKNDNCHNNLGIKGSIVIE